MFFAETGTSAKNALELAERISRHLGIPLPQNSTLCSESNSAKVFSSTILAETSSNDCMSKLYRVVKTSIRRASSIGTICNGSAEASVHDSLAPCAILSSVPTAITGIPAV